MFRGKYVAGMDALFTAGRLEFHEQLEPLSTPPQFATLLREGTDGLGTQFRWF